MWPPKVNPFETLPSVWRNLVLQCDAVHRIVGERLVAELRRDGIDLDLREGWVLIATRDLDASQSVIAESLGVNRNIMVGIVDSLERKGIVRRRRAPNRREYRIDLTSKGEALLTRILEGSQERALRVFEPLTSEDLASFQEYMRRIIENHYLPGAPHPADVTQSSPM